MDSCGAVFVSNTENIYIGGNRENIVQNRLRMPYCSLWLHHGVRQVLFSQYPNDKARKRDVNGVHKTLLLYN